MYLLMAHICSLDILFFPIFHNFSASLVVCTSTHSYAYIRYLCIFCILVLIPHACGSYISCSKALFSFSVCWFGWLWGRLDLFANDCNVPSYFFRHLCTCCLLVLYLLAVFALLLCFIAYSTTFFRNFISSVILIFIESLSLIILFVLNLFTRWLSIFLFFCHIYIIS